MALFTTLGTSWSGMRDPKLLQPIPIVETVKPERPSCWYIISPGTSVPGSLPLVGILLTTLRGNIAALLRWLITALLWWLITALLWWLITALLRWLVLAVLGWLVILRRLLILLRVGKLLVALSIELDRRC